MSESATNMPPEEAAGRQPFHVEALGTMDAAAGKVLATHPEIRGIAVAIDYHPPLDESRLPHGLWRGEQGPIRQLDEVVGGIEATLRLLRTQMKHLEEVRNTLLKEAVDAARTLTAREKPSE